MVVPFRSHLRASLSLLALSSVLVACSGSTPATAAGDAGKPNASGDAGFFSPCRGDDDCASKYCMATSTGGYCSTTCHSTSDCPALTICDVDPNTPEAGGTCTIACDATSTCEEGSDGLDCICNTGDACWPGRGCEPIGGPGDPCALDANCKSANCSLRTNTCAVEVGGPCTADDCQLCEHWPSNNVTYCSRPCASDSDCNGHGGSCTCDFSGNNCACTRQCNGPTDPSCPGGCGTIEGSSQWICNCDDNCTQTIQPGALGASCGLSTQCATGTCQGGLLCSVPCTSDMDCGGNAACIECGAGCGSMCFLTCGADVGCAAGTCASGTTVGGASVQYCDYRSPLGSMCNDSASCESGRCSAGGTCIASGGIPSGTSCTSKPSDCSSGSCCNDVCC